LRIGFDAKWFFTGNPSGRVVVSNILPHLVAQNPQHEFYIFLKESDKDKTFPIKESNVHIIYVWGEISLLSNIFIIPLKAWRLRLDVFLFQYNSPLFSNFIRIAYIYDVIFESSPQYFTLREKIYFSPMRLLARHAQKICTISKSERNRILKYKYSKNNNVDVVYLGVREAFKPRSFFETTFLDEVKKTYNLPDDFVLYVGRLNERKNISNLFYAIPLVKNKSVKFVFAGTYDGKSFDALKKIEELKIKDKVILTGFVKDEHLPPLYSLARLFCYVSYDEGFGLPPVESMAAGVPVVVANTGSLPEVCGDAGNYIDPHKPEEIAFMIDTLLADDSLYEKKAAIGISRAKEFTWQKAAEQLMHSIQNTII